MPRWTDERIVFEAEKLAANFAAEHGYRAVVGLYCQSIHPRRRGFWNLARAAFFHLQKTDPDDAVSALEESELDSICVKLGRPVRFADYCS